MATDTRRFKNGKIAHSQVTLVEASIADTELPFYLVVLHVQVALLRERTLNLRYDLGKRVFIDRVNDPDFTYQIRRVELIVGDRLTRLFAHKSAKRA